MRTSTTSTAKRAAFVLGLALAGLAVLGWRIPAGGGSLGADLTVLATRSGELDVTPVGPVLVAGGMQPGSRVARGAVTVRNQTGSALAVRLRALPSSRDLDRVLTLQLESGERRLFRGPLGSLRRFTRRPLRLTPGSEARLELRAWLSASARDSYRGRIETVMLDFRSSPLEGAR